MRLLLINARSLPKNISNVTIFFFLLLNDGFSIIGISETWLSDINDPLVQIPGCVLEGSCRQNKIGGGVGLYIKHELVYKTRDDLRINNPDIESFFIELINSHSSNTIVGVIYKPPSASCTNFTNLINDVLGNINYANKKCYIMGDFNINLLHYDTDNSVQNVIDTLSSQSFYPSITKQTRITGDSSTLIDRPNIFTNDFYDHSSGILITDISDHLPVFLELDHLTKTVKGNSTFTKRHFTPNTINNFVHDINDKHWDFVTSLKVANVVYNTFICCILKLYNKHFPLKETNYRYDTTKSPWLSSGLYNSI